MTLKELKKNRIKFLKDALISIKWSPGNPGYDPSSSPSHRAAKALQLDEWIMTGDVTWLRWFGYLEIKKDKKLIKSKS